MAFKVLEGFLLDLHTSKDEHAGVALVGNIETCFSQEMSPQEHGVCLNLLMGASEYSLVNQITTQPPRVKAAILQFFSDTIDKQTVTPYAARLQNAAFQAMRGESISVKNKAFALFDTLMKMRLDLEYVAGSDAAPLSVYIEGLFRELQQSKSKLSSARGNCLSSLGLLADLNGLTEEQAKKLAALYMNTLAQEINSVAKPEPKLLEGIFQGLKYFLNKDAHAQLIPSNAKKKVERLEFLFECIILSIRATTDESRYNVLRAALALFTHHPSKFRVYMKQKCEEMLEILLKLCTHKNDEIRSKGGWAFEAFMTQVCADIGHIKTNQDEAAHDKNLFYFLLKFFVLKLDNNKTVDDVTMSVRAFGQLAVPIVVYMGEGELVKFMQRLLRTSDRLYNGSPDEIESAMSYFPSFMSSYASMIQQLGRPNIDVSVLAQLRDMIGPFFKTFPNMVKKKRDRNYLALTQLFLVLHGKGVIFNQLIDQIVWYGLALTISQLPEHQTRGVAGVGNFQNKERRAYRQYCDLWHALLSSDRYQTFSKEEQVALPQMQRVIYDTLVSHILKMLRTLTLDLRPAVPDDLSGPDDLSQEQAFAFVQGDVGTQLKPAKAKDFELYLNLVEFFKIFFYLGPLNDAGEEDTFQAQPVKEIKEDVLNGPAVLRFWFKPWILIYGREVIALSERHPLVSGFYKMTAIIMRIGEEQGYFEGCVAVKQEEDAKVPKSEDTSMVPSTSGDSLGNRQFLAAMVTKFLGEVVTRIQQYKAELLFSTIHVVLSVPLTFVDVPQLLPALQKCLNIGLNFHQAATLAMDVMERWLTYLPDKMKPCLPAILPSLSAYIRPTTAPASTAVVAESEDSKSDGKVLELPPAVAVVSEEETLVVSRILNFLGKMGGENRFVLDVQSEQDLALAWDSVQHIRYALPFPSHKLDVYLDPLLPHITNLAQHCSNRKTKVAACETLHSIIIYMVASGARDPNRQASQARPAADSDAMQFVPHKLYLKLFPVVVKLAVDVETVANQLYAPLVKQLIHWLTNNQKAENKETMALLDTLTESLCDPADGALRDYSANCIAEFFKWSVKQSANNPVNVVSLLRRLYSLAQHPNAYKRLGAALAFNQIYRYFREENHLVSVYVLDLFNNMLLSLSMAEKDDVSLGTKEEVRKVLSNTERIVTDPGPKKYKHLLKPNPKRQGPVHCQTLEQFITWLFENVGRREEACRRMCHNLFQSFVPLIDATRGWVDKYVNTNGLEKVIAIFEKGGVAKGTATSIVAPKWLGGGGPGLTLLVQYEELLEWLECMGASIDCYHWALKLRLLDPNVILAGKNPDVRPKLLLAIHIFITKASVLEEWAKPLLLSQHHTYQQVRCMVIIRIFRLVWLLLDTFPEFELVRKLLDVNFYKLLFESLLSPKQNGFDVVETGRIHQLQDTIGGLCKSLNRVEPCRELATRVLRECLSSPLISPGSFVVQTLIQDVGFYSLLSNGYKFLWTSGLLTAVLGEAEAKEFANQLGKNSFLLSVQYSQKQADSAKSQRVLTPLHRYVGTQMLELALHIGMDNKQFFAYLSDKSTVPNGEEKMKDESSLDPEEKQSSSSSSSTATTALATFEATKGEDFYNNFRLLIDSFLMVRFAAFGAPLCRSVFMAKELYTILINLADHAIRMRQRKGTLYLDADHPFRAADTDESAKERDAVENFVPSLLKVYGPAFVWWAKRNEKVVTKQEPLSFEEDLPNITMSLDLIQKLLVLEERQTLHPENPSYSFITDLYFQCLSRNAPFPLKKTALATIVPFILASEPTCSKAMTAVQKMTTYSPFPSKSIDLDESSIEWHQYTQLLESVLAAFVQAKSFVFMQKLLGVLRERNHKCLDKILQSCQDFISRLNQPGKMNEILEMCNACASLFLNSALDRSPVDNARRFVIERITVPLLKCAPLSVVKNFFVAHGQIFWKMIEEKPNGPTKSKSIEEQQVELVELTCCYQLLEVLLRRLQQPELEDTKIVHKQLMKMAHTHLKKCGEKSEEHVSYLDFHRAAYNCLSAGCIRTQHDPKFFDLLLFKENPSQDQLLWENIVDLKLVLNFQIAASYKQVEARLLTEIDSKFLESRKTERRARYLQSQYLADSSLSQDVAKMSSFLDASRNNSEDYEDVIPSEDESGLARERERGRDRERRRDDERGGGMLIKEEKEQKEKDDEIDISAGEVVDLDPLNTNSCMAAMLDVIDHMFRVFGRSWGSDMPQFMSFMHAKLSQTSTHVNIKWFITKIVINRWLIFERYAHAWFRPLVELALMPNNGGEGFHYMLRDLCYLFLQWTDFIPRDNTVDRDLASSFLARLFAVSSDYGHDETELWMRLRANLRLVKLLVEKWKTRVTIDKTVILSKLKFPIDVGSRTGGQGKYERYVGLQLMGVILANGFPAYDPLTDAHIKQEELIVVLLDNLQQRKDIYQPAAEVFGMILKAQYEDTTGEHLALRDKYQLLFRQHMKKLFQAQDWEKLLMILQKVGVHVHDRHFLDGQIMNMILSLPAKLSGTYHAMALQLIFWGALDMENGYQKLRPMLARVLKDKDEKAHEMLLLVTIRILPQLVKDEIHEYIPQLIQAFIKHPNERCRGLLFKVLINVYDHWKKEDSHPSVLAALLRGLSDPSAAVSKTMFEFWDHESRLPLDLAERLLSCLTTLHQPDTENDWLRYCTFLLMNPLHRSTDYNRPFSDTPLAECKFEDVTINSQGSSATMGFTPLFSVSSQGELRARTAEELAKKEGETAMAPGMIKNTQAAEFSLTQDTASMMSMNASQLFDYNLNSQLADTKYIIFRPGLAHSQGGSQDVMMGSLAEFNAVSRQKHDLKKRKNLRAKGGVKFVTMNDIIQRRFFKKTGNFDPHHVKSSGVVTKIRELDLTRRYKNIWKARMREEASQAVTMYRKYRKGELPDIQIHHRELLLPLQALHSEPVVSKHLFHMIFKAIYQNLDKMHIPNRANILREKIKEAIAHLLSNRSLQPASSFLFALHLATLEGGAIDSEFTYYIQEGGVASIGDSAFSSKNFHSGAMLLEHMLSKPISDAKPSQAKRAKSAVGGVVLSSEERRDQEVWFQLARLYRELGDEDIVLSLYNKYANSHYTKEAVAAGLRGDYAHAIITFDKALDHDQAGRPWEGTAPTPKEIDYWEDERLECCHLLTEWENLRENVLVQFDQDRSKIWSSDIYLRHYILSTSKITKYQQELYDFISQGLSEPLKREKLEAKYSVELSLIYAQFGATERAQYFLKQSHQNFLNQWSQLPLLAKGPRVRLLQSLQKLIEIGEFLVTHPDTNPVASRSVGEGWDEMLSRARDLTEAWSKRYPSRLDPVNVWDDIIVNRTFFLDHLNKSLSTRLGLIENKVGERDMERQERLVSLKTKAAKLCIEGYRRAAAVMAKVGNLTVAESYLSRARKLSAISSDDHHDQFLLQFSLYNVKYCKTRLITTEHEQQKAESLWRLRDSLLKLDDDLTDSGLAAPDKVDPFLLFKFNKLQARVHVDLADMLERDASFGAAGDSSKPSDLFSDAQDLLSEACRVFRGREPKKDMRKEFDKASAKCHLLFAAFCLKQLNSMRLKKLPDLVAEYTQNYVESVFEAMLLNSSTARNEIPRVLELVAKCPVDSKPRKTFTDHTTRIHNGSSSSSNSNLAKARLPEWMFLQWIPQMLSVLGEAEGPLVFPILESIALAYPQAIYYPFQLSKETIRSQEPINMQASKYLDLLGSSLCIPVMDKFIEALDGMTDPDLKAKDFFARFIKLLQKNKHQQATALYQEFYKACVQGTREHVGYAVGDANIKFSKQTRTFFDAGFGGPMGERVKGMSAVDADQLHKKLMASLQKTKAGRSRLSVHSQWLADFTQNAFSEYIELPGQYSGKERPQPENHIKIINFDGWVNIMSSIRRPKALVIHGSDEKDYKFLVKGGEDLRLDQRIEQLFDAMNVCLQRDPKCAKRMFNIRTYQVVPMTTRVGVLEWVSGTIPLKAVIDTQAKKADQDLREPASEYSQWIIKNSGLKEDSMLPTHFLGVLSTCHEKVVVKAFDKIQNILNKDLLIKAVAALCCTPESFLVLRSKFARSFSVFSICSYILGIGDRHLENFLLDQTDGTLVGIDFGASFGQGVLLHVPELMPFRFTKQFQNLLAPLDTAGLLRQDMSYTLAALRDQSQTLLTIMEVFVKEPQMDWVEFARAKITSRSDGADENESVSWYAQAKVETARKKLMGVHPCEVMVEELKQNVHLQKQKGLLARVIEIVRGNPASIRRQLTTCHTIEEQVECLVDQAMDPNILGRTWNGWMPYL